MKKVAFYGGTFDPPHIGHVSAARAFAGYTGADMLYIIPNYIPPLKDGCRPASADDRLAMASLAFGGEKTVISDYEIKNGGVSYTFMTAEHLASMHPGAQLFMLVGTDQPSVGRPEAERTAHRALLSYGIAVLENLDLSHAPDGRYRLFAAPLKIAGGEAAPCRALLRRYTFCKRTQFARQRSRMG